MTTAFQVAVVMSGVAAVAIGSMTAVAMMTPAKHDRAAAPVTAKIVERAPQEPVSTETIAIRTIPIAKQTPLTKVAIAAPIDLPKAESPIEPTEQPVSPARHSWRRHAQLSTGGDLCAQHHLHKVETNRGKGWRCR
jgi:hypothetical protein